MTTPEQSGWRGAWGTFAQTWQRVVTDPNAFFAEMPQAGGLGEPGTFLLICAALNALGHFVLGWGLGGALGVLVAQIVVTVLLAAVLTLIAQHLFDGRAGFEPTFRVVAWSSAPLVLAWLPLVGKLARLWAAYLMMRGTERVHAMDTTRSVLAVVLAVVAVWLVAGSWTWM